MSDEAAAPSVSGAALLTGAAEIEAGIAPEISLENLRALQPAAAARALETKRIQAERTAQLHELLRARFAVEPEASSGGPLIPAERHFELATTLQRELGYQQYVTVCACHFPAQKSKSGEDPEHFEVATVLRVPGPGSVHASWRVRLPVGGDIDSLVPLFAGADWQEREQYDLVGVKFRGHPDLRRIMLPDEWEGHPLRKDYAIDTRCAPWR